jgi:hypothetical protein
VMISVFQWEETDWWTGSKKQDPIVCFLRETHLNGKDKHKVKVKRYFEQMEPKSKQ